jgi:hypothetical protein
MRGLLLDTLVVITIAIGLPLGMWACGWLP